MNKQHTKRKVQLAQLEAEEKWSAEKRSRQRAGEMAALRAAMEEEEDR